MFSLIWASILPSTRPGGSNSSGGFPGLLPLSCALLRQNPAPETTAGRAGCIQESTPPDGTGLAPQRRIAGSGTALRTRTPYVVLPIRRCQFVPVHSHEPNECGTTWQIRLAGHPHAGEL